MKKYYPILAPIILFKLVVQFLGNRNYGFHRDELLHLSVSEHLAWGYFEFPPFIAFIGKLSYLLFDYSLIGVRLFPTLAGIGIIYFSCRIATEMGGKSKAVLLAGVSILAFAPFYRTHTLFQPNAFDQFFWILGFFFLVRYLNTEDKKHLLLLGFIAGLGLLNKYTMLFWGLGISVGLLFFEKGKTFKSKWLYISGLIALIVFLPNIIWQIQNGIPFFDHVKELRESHFSEQGTWDFMIEFLVIPPAQILSFVGLFAVFGNSRFKKYRALGVAFLVIFFSMWYMNAKPYYFFSAYPIIFAIAAVQVERWLDRRPGWYFAVLTSFLLPVVYLIPMMTPILPIEVYTSLYNEPEENGRYELTGDYADMFGWEEQVALINSIYQSLPDSIQENTQIWAENYGEAGAIKILGDKYNLPDAISRHGTFWSWGYGNATADVWLTLGNEEGAVSSAFNSCELIKIVNHPYAIGEENGIPIYICKDPKVDIPKWWADFRPYIFD